MKRGIFLFFLISGSIHAGIQPFPDKPIMVIDTEDFRLFSIPPEEYKAATIWDGVDELILRPIPELFAFKYAKRAKNVNALDEVPDSSWWTNRNDKSFRSENIKNGACEKPIDPRGPYEVISGKPDGWNPGFLVKAPDGKKYFFKFDQHEQQPERMSTAEVVGSLIYHAIGFTVPCYEILYFDKSAIKLTPKSTMKNNKGDKVPMTEEYLNEAFRLAKKTESGKVRAVSSLLLEGIPLGPWRYAGTLNSDPNDVIAHEDRREVRGGYVLASWLSHFDTRDQNTLSTWIQKENNKQGYVRHNLLDFGDSMGNISNDDAISRRLGYAYYADFGYFAQDFLTFGFIERPWDKVKYGLAGAVLGYFDTEHFDPDKWSPGYPNPAFQNMQEADGAWMARKIVRFSEEHITSIIDSAKIQNTVFKNELRSHLIGRRKKLLNRWLRKLSPLAEPVVFMKEQKSILCLTDLSLMAGLVQKENKTFTAHWIDSEQGNRHDPIQVESPNTEHKVCVSFPSEIKEKSSYRILEIQGVSEIHPDEKPIRVHLYHTNSLARIAGLERVE